MKTEAREYESQGIYQVGLNRQREAVISAHFMHNINQRSKHQLYSSEEFSKKALLVNAEIIIERLIPTLLSASDTFILERASAAKIRARKNFKEYGLNSAQKISLSEVITEVMFDRQFLKGSKSNTSRRILAEKIRKLIAEHKPIKMVIPALPYKVSSPLKTRGNLPDLSEINFLLALVEIAKTIDLIYSSTIAGLSNKMASFTVICDGNRFNQFLNEKYTTIKQYQNHLRWWISKLGFSNYVEISDYQHIIKNNLPQKTQEEKTVIREQVGNFYKHLMLPLLDPYNMEQTINKAIECDPDPEITNPEGRFIPLFKSLIYTVRYEKLSLYSEVHQEDYSELYSVLTRHLFQPYAKLTRDDYVTIEAFIGNPQPRNSPSRNKLLEYLRQSMLSQAWHATINYMAEIRSDRDLPKEPLSLCYPEYIRWTIHAKPGQFAVLTTTAFGDPVQPWHGVGVFMRTKNNKIKLYTLPVLSLESCDAVPVIVEKTGQEPRMKGQPLFYIHPNIKWNHFDDFIEELKKGLTRKRKL
ncbi:L-tyrosine/L-tryptophan isonitrile synthase family protein [Fluoribacter dumoffii]|uniref:L-tyrosine/L-tryptophan isonitrile synthase family protein n=1 Tax=Fluoribacter dumoffii TaxID=463 RepID=UPI0022436A45|nr:L-tyrosine/L-tryptophan isonitrile synthase family protein [Fluoribacter dumoffii]MCW8419410.1 L-tyrosine/L-tryptophan isonitrile synthase family protein [Fluoribacter dumoffii]MCW8452715.1 L-tyrosine/L-tryptophan isonitrile synthase family protein [Fluoribacter dumoffii]MCW8460035.1 L-tyrosine/L-tryptophan isonitrile synthase family protein [Fluoribacter dumoffii]MCW8483513.1 L-tyrosine/L-tryptophan isonitrile synthase family protein [Fluoribacter dumoffii]